MTYRFTLPFFTVPELNPVEAVIVAAEAGFDHVGFRLLPVADTELPYALLTDHQLLQEVLAALKDTGITAGELEIVRVCPDTRLEAYLPMFERAQALGATDIVVVGEDNEFNRLTQQIGRLSEAAAKYGLILNLEPMPYKALASLEQAQSVICALNRHNIAIMLDALQLHRIGVQPNDLQSLIAGQCRIFQLCDAPWQFDPDPTAMRNFARSARLLPGEGELDLVGMLRASPANLTISVEVPSSVLQTKFCPLERAQRALAAAKKVCKKTKREQ